ncbi:MAG: deoxyhypusine synthase [Thermoguttaceae bacterium]|nr:deoxyhypusine synthase [Thermoguttaceae bacterium]MDW8077675.1 deoxyhypusine synthase [Thermoguttaceae bacterium]
MAEPRKKEDFLHTPVEHIDITRYPVVELVEAMGKMAYSARDLARAADIYHRMLSDRECAVILCIAGSLVSAGLRKMFADMVRFRMVDIVVATGANIVDQDFFEALGFRHYQGDLILRTGLYDETLRELYIDRIYDTLIDEEQLRICDDTVRQIADQLEPRPYSSREFIYIMGAYLESRGLEDENSLVFQAYKHGVPIFCPAFSDCSAGFGLLLHQVSRAAEPKVSIDSVKDFVELAQLKVHVQQTGLVMLGGGVPKNFAQDVVVATDLMGTAAPMHRYAIQITVADVRDGGLSGSTLREATSWGKVDVGYEQMVFSEVTLAAPLIVGYAYHKGAWRNRVERRLNDYLGVPAVTVG